MTGPMEIGSLVARTCEIIHITFCIFIYGSSCSHRKGRWLNQGRQVDPNRLWHRLEERRWPGRRSCLVDLKCSSQIGGSSTVAFPSLIDESWPLTWRRELCSPDRYSVCLFCASLPRPLFLSWDVRCDYIRVGLEESQFNIHTLIWLTEILQ